MSFRKLLRHESILAVLLVLALVASSNLSDRFLTIDNLLNQGRMMTEAGIIAVASTSAWPSAPRAARPTSW